jgi:DNA-3-methyladenine glycosylase
MKKLPASFYQRPAIELARDLIGKLLVRPVSGETCRARIVETEAYVGTHDLACHAARGRTRRTEVMFGPGGHAYVYFIYGMHEMFNIVASVAGDAQAVLVRAAEPMDGWEVDLSGPGKLARGMRITRALNGVDLTGDDLFLTQDVHSRPRIVTGPRVGVDYAGEWVDAPLRFVDADSSAVSKPWPAEMRGRLNRPTSDDGGRRLQGEPGCPQPGRSGRGRPGSSR